VFSAIRQNQRAPRGISSFSHELGLPEHMQIFASGEAKIRHPFRVSTRNAPPARAPAELR
jgi:hypothetical protein